MTSITTAAPLVDVDDDEAGVFAHSADAHPFPGTVAESLALVVAPSTGRFRPQDLDGHGVAGQLIGHITGGRGRADEVRMPVDGRVRSFLVRPGQLVRAGQSLAWLDRSARV